MFKTPLDIAKENIEYVIQKEKEKIKINKNYNLAYYKNRLKTENQIINNESISTNISSNNVSNFINNSNYSSKGKLALNNKFKDISNSKKLFIDIDSNQKKEKNNDLKIILNQTYTERNSINNTIENNKEKYKYNINNKLNKNIFKNQSNNYKYNDNSRYRNNIRNNQNSFNIFKKESKYRQNLINDKVNISINSKSNIKSNGINFPNIQNNINFNNNRLNELCKKMNFDALEIK